MTPGARKPASDANATKFKFCCVGISGIVRSSWWYVVVFITFRGYMRGVFAWRGMWARVAPVYIRIRVYTYATNQPGPRGLGGGDELRRAGRRSWSDGMQFMSDPPPQGVAEKRRGSLAAGGIYITHPPFPVLGRFGFPSESPPSRFSPPSFLRHTSPVFAPHFVRHGAF